MGKDFSKVLRMSIEITLLFENVARSAILAHLIKCAKTLHEG